MSELDAVKRQIEVYEFKIEACEIDIAEAKQRGDNEMVKSYN